MAEQKKIILYSIEIAARELVPKCLLALECAKLGMRVYMGSFRALKQLDGKVDGCIFFHKSTWNKNASRLRKTIGAHFVFLDEEMGPSLPKSELNNYLSNRYSAVSAANYEHTFAIGDMHKASMEELENFKGVQVHALGWPRLDLWRKPFHQLYTSETERIRTEHGKFYLLISSFGAISESSYHEAVKSHAEHYNQNSSRIDYNYNNFKSCIKLIHELSPKLDKNEKIIVRPHTSESVDEWENHVRDLPNVYIQHKGDVTPWLLASEGTIQFGSTVGIQAVCMGVPSIQYHDNIERPGITDTLPFELLDSTTSANGILNFLRDSKNKDTEDLRKPAIERLDGIVSCLDGSLASTQIAETLNGIEVAPQNPIHFNSGRRFILWFKEQINYLNYLKSSRLLKREHMRSKRSKFEKIPNGLKEDDIRETIKRLAIILGDDPKRIKCRQVAHNLVEIEFD
jgi:surface carbohydrate biosynthesis protein